MFSFYDDVQFRSYLDRVCYLDTRRQFLSSRPDQEARLSVLASQLRLLPVRLDQVLHLLLPPLLPLVLALEPGVILGLLPLVVLQQIQTLPVHLHLEKPVHARLSLLSQLPLPDQREHLVPPARGVHDPLGRRLPPAEAPGLEHHLAVGPLVGQLDAEDGRHGRLERGAKLELVEAAEPPVGGHDAVVVVHGEHETPRKGVPVEQGHRGHRVGQEAPEQRPQAAGPVGAAAGDGVAQVQAVGEELGQRRGGHHAAGGQGELDQVQGLQEGLAHGRGEAVVWRGGQRQEVDAGRGLGDGDGPAWVAITCRDWDAVERFGHDGVCFPGCRQV